MSSGEDQTQPAKLLSPGGATSVGDRLIADRYHIVDWLGAGGMGTVYRARDLLLGEHVALKILKPELALEAGSVERFRREVKLARRVSHRNVARMFDIGEHEGEHFLVMELVDGESLSALVRRGALPFTRILTIADAVCAGLGAAHEAGVVHRDLKPENVMIAMDGRTVITDFGVARAASGPSAGPGETERGVAVGMPWYMAPEQLLASEVDHRADLWSLGVMLYELVGSVRPFPGDSVGAVAVAQTRGPAYDLRALRPDAPAPLVAVIARLLQLDRERRFRNAADVARALGGVGAPAGRTTTSPGAMVTAIAVLPLRCAPADAYLADGMLDDLIDTLSMTRGLRVRSRGAVQALEALPPEQAGQRLDVGVVVEGSLRRQGERLRITARLIQVGDGFQVHAARLDCTEAEILDASEKLAREIAGALSTRVERASSRPTDARAVELYLRARGELRRFWRAHLVRAVELLDQARALAPDAPAVLAARAYAMVRLWLMGEGHVDPRGELAYAAALEAIAAAPDHGEARLALGMARINRGEVEAGVADLAWAVARTPLLSSAHEQAGRILVEVGAGDEGLARLKNAIRLDPDHAPMLECEVARVHALGGRWDDMARTLSGPLADEDVAVRLLAQVLAARLGMWRGQLNDAWAETASESGNRIIGIFLRLLRERVIEDVDWGWMMGFVGDDAAALRSRLFIGQIATEMAMASARPERALDALEAAADHGLFDRLWIDHCPLLAPLASEPRFVAVRRRIAERAASVLDAYRGADAA